jgi:ribosomal protein L37AE/L43A
VLIFRNPADASMYEEDSDLVECPDCGRNFASERLLKHANVCKKVFATKRKGKKYTSTATKLAVFDASKHRVEGTEAAQFVAKAKREEAKVTFTWF